MGKSTVGLFVGRLVLFGHMVGIVPETPRKSYLMAQTRLGIFKWTTFINRLPSLTSRTVDAVLGLCSFTNHRERIGRSVQE